MKILNITLKNLNSLRGEWKIDLNDSAYTSGGIFAVTGPTGAGKTTIFDAVCLALYGRTPRLNTNHKDEIAEIMSKHTNKCTASVKFKAGGKIYVCEWSLTRTRDKHGDEKFDTVHTIEEDSINEDRLQKQNGASSIVAEKTGLDFRQFTQAALLAQGDFDAFLKGNTPERAKILELLTDSGKYGDISKSIARHTDDAKNLLDAIRVKRDAMTPNDDFSSEEEISLAINETRTIIRRLEGERSELESALSWLRGIREIRNELLRNQAEIDRVGKSIASFTEKRTRLEAGIRAKSILHEYSALIPLRKQYSDTDTRFQNQQRQFENERSKLARQEREMMSLEAELGRITAGLPEGETPASICTKAEIRVQSFIDIYKEKAKVSSDKADVESKYAKAKAELALAESNNASAREKYEQARSKSNELSNARVSAILEAERMKLKPGVPCPVCGSLEHPAAGHTEGISSGEIQRIDGDLKTAQERENHALRISQEAANKLSQAQTQEGTLRASLEQFMRQENEYNAKIK